MKVLHDIKLNLRFENGPDILKLRDSMGRPRPDRKEEEETREPKTPLLSKAEIDRETEVRARRRRYLKTGGQVHIDEIWACTTCAACVQACPVLIDSVPGSLIGLRQGLVMMESEFPQEATSAFKGLEVQGNPWGVGADAPHRVGRRAGRPADRRPGPRGGVPASGWAAPGPPTPGPARPSRPW